MAFEIRVPTGKGGDKGNGTSAGGGSKETNKLLKKLDKSMIANIDVLEILTSFFGDVIKLFQPLIKILSLLFLVIFLPLLPLLTLLIKGLASFVKLLTGGFGGIAAFLGKIILGILLATLAFFLTPLAAGAAGITAVVVLVIGAISLFSGALLDVIKWIGTWIGDAGKFLGEGIKLLVQSIVNGATWLWESIISGFDFILGIGEKIWGFFLDGLSFIGNLGQRIWGFIKSALSFISNLGQLIWNKISSGLSSLFGGGRANGGPVNSGTTYLVGERGPELFSPSTSGSIIPNGSIGGATTININNPTVRNDSDIRKMTDSISRALQRKGNRGFS